METKDFLQYIKHFNIHYNLLLRRYQRFIEIDDIYSNRYNNIIFKAFLISQSSLYRKNCSEGILSFL